MQKYVLTTNLSPQLYQWLNTEAKARSATKRRILEESLEKARVAGIRQKMIEDYNELANDKEYMTEMHGLAEAGLSDWSKQLDKIDGGYFSKRDIPRKPRSRQGKRAGR